MNKERFENKENFSANKSKIIEAVQTVLVLGGTLLSAEGFVNKGYADIAAGLIIVGVAALWPFETKIKK
jgi:hypothetical protein